MTRINDGPTRSAAMVPVAVEGWTVFDDVEGGHWLRDLDIAERAGLKDAHDIRRTILAAIKDGSIVPGSDRNDDSPMFREVETISPMPRGASRKVIEFYLNEAGALLILMRLRTPKAIEATKAVVRIFLAVARGEYASAAVMRRLGDMEARAEIDRQENLLLRSKIELLDPTSTGLIGEARANLLRGMLRQAARMYVGSTGSGRPQSETKERDNELRMHVGFAQGIEQRWEHLPIAKFGDAMAKAHEILGRERNRAKRLAPPPVQMGLQAPEARTPARSAARR